MMQQAVAQELAQFRQRVWRHSPGHWMGVHQLPDGGVCFGVLADRDLDPPLSTAAAGLIASLGEVQAAAA